MPSPEPADGFGRPLIRLVADSGATVGCAGGGGVPVVAGADGRPHGVEAVVDNGLAAALLASALRADALLLLTDVAAVEDGHGTPPRAPSATSDPPTCGPTPSLVGRGAEGGGRVPVRRLGGALAAIGRL
ncbi:hypothetical protein ABZ215_14580 [Amycolatopsis sp. NPDC006131]|uniref:amino acid kinase family protein n=1 Tax=Amycolatopsis sp. NPDC006131 TaxID=3156731 RepID=UPI0033A51045